MPIGEIYIKLAVSFPNDPKVRALARYGTDAGLARDLYVQMCLYCKDLLTDGFVPAEQVGLLVYPLDQEHGNQLAKQLASVGLIKEASKDEREGWQVLAYLKRNGSREDVERLSEVRAEAGRKGGRPSGKTAGQKPGQAHLKQVGKQTESRQNPYTESESDTEEDQNTSGRPAGRAPEPGSDDDPDFVAFWDAYPRKVGKGGGRKAWRSAIRTKRADPKTIIIAAERYRDDPRRPRDPQFIPHPSTWLNEERWLEYQDSGPSEVAGPAPMRFPWDN